jgi:hypothetical protein
MSHRRKAVVVAAAVAVGLVIAGFSYSQAMATGQPKPKPAPAAGKHVVSPIIADVNAPAASWTDVTSTAPSKLNSMVAPAATAAFSALPGSSVTPTSYRLLQSQGSGPTEYVVFFTVDSTAGSPIPNIVPMSSIAVLYDSSYTLQGVESNLITTPVAPLTRFTDSDGNTFKYQYLHYVGSQPINIDPPTYLNDMPSATSTDPTCLAYSAFQFAVDLDATAMDIGQLDETAVDTQNDFGSAISFATNEYAATECPNGE